MDWNCLYNLCTQGSGAYFLGFFLAQKNTQVSGFFLRLLGLGSLKFFVVIFLLLSPTPHFRSCNYVRVRLYYAVSVCVVLVCTYASVSML